MILPQLVTFTLRTENEKAPAKTEQRVTLNAFSVNEAKLIGRDISQNYDDDQQDIMRKLN